MHWSFILDYGLHSMLTHWTWKNFSYLQNLFTCSGKHVYEKRLTYKSCILDTLKRVVNGFLENFAIFLTWWLSCVFGFTSKKKMNLFSALKHREHVFKIVWHLKKKRQKKKINNNKKQQIKQKKSNKKNPKHQTQQRKFYVK